MNKKVWVSWAMMNEASYKPLDADILLNDPDQAVDAMRRNERGEPLLAELFPKDIWGDEDAGRLRKQPDFFFADGYWCVSAKAAEVLRGFDLGEGALYPVNIFQNDRKTRIEGEYFCLNFGAIKQAFLPEHSPRARASHERENIWTPGFVTKDDDIAVSPAALEGPDLWVDPKLERSFFVSGALEKSLKEAKARRAFSLRKCRIIEEN